MKRDNIYYINGNAYAGKSTIVKLLSKRHNGIACEENYHNQLLEKLNRDEFPCLTYIRDLVDWRGFIRRTPEEYEVWMEGCNRECAILEMKILEELSQSNQKIFVDTNIPIDILKKISDKTHVLIMLANPQTSVEYFFDRPDRDKNFLYNLIITEPNPIIAMENFKNCLKRVNSLENYNKFLNSGFNVILRDESRTVEQTLHIAEKYFGLL